MSKLSKVDIDGKIAALVVIFAGEKLDRVLALADKLQDEGKQKNRALADALEKFNCPKTFPDREKYA